MKNIPFFTTEVGIASITLEEIAFNKTAYVRIQSSTDPQLLLQQCTDFCRAVGAEHVYVAGEWISQNLPYLGSVIRMSRLREGLPVVSANTVPVNADSLEAFRKIYNDAMYNIPNAAGMSLEKAKGVLADGTGYFVYQNDNLIGIGIAAGEWIHAIVSVKRGMGEVVLLALNRILTGSVIRVELIDCNLPAIQLYDRLGFDIYETVSSWYKIL